MQDRRSRIYNESGKLKDEDRQALGAILMKAGYAARVGSEKRGSQRIYFVEYWREEE